MSPLKCERRAMPGLVRDALERRGLMPVYLACPDYQQNDYIRWITEARQPETRHRRLDQMLQELDCGHLSMKVAWGVPVGTKTMMQMQSAHQEKP